MEHSQSSRQAPLVRHDSGGEGHVHFAENQVTPDHAGQIVVVINEDKKKAEVSLGFLQLHHRYLITLNLPLTLGDSVKMTKVNPNVSLKAVDHSQDLKTQVLTVELYAHQDKLLQEELHLHGSTGSFLLELSARVLGPGKGTPALKNGVKCIAIENDESDMSDNSLCARFEKERRLSRGSILPLPQDFSKKSS